MEIKHRSMNRLMGVLLIVLGILSLFEVRRILDLGISSGLVGDHTFPLILGIFFIAAGVYFQFVGPDQAVIFPQGPVLRKMLWCLAILIVYWMVIPYLGYTVSTFLGSAALFRVMGEYKWWQCIFYGAAVAIFLHFIFRVWLYLPFPSGWLGI